MQPSLLSTIRPTYIQTTSAVSSSAQAMFTLPTATRCREPCTVQQSRVGMARPTQTMSTFSGNVQHRPPATAGYHPFAGQYYVRVG